MVVHMSDNPNSPAVPIPSAAMLGNHIRAARLRKGLTQRDLAKHLYCSLRWITEVENGKDTAQIGKVLSLCQFLDLKVLLGFPNDVNEAGSGGGAGSGAGNADGAGGDYPDLDTIMGGQS
jgi:y4mF family transcriptional regulator